jgi:hypothetical protein
MNCCKNLNCEPCKLMRTSERDANHKIRELQKESQYINLISERARVKQRDINQKIREVERETTELKRDIAQAAMEKEKEIRRQAAGERRKQAWSAMTEQEKQESNRETMEKLLPALLEEVKLRVGQTLFTFEEKIRSSQNQYSTPNQSIPITLHNCGPDCGSASTSASRRPATYPVTPRLPSQSRFANVQQRRHPHSFIPSEIAHPSFCRCYSCFRRLCTQGMVTNLANSENATAYFRRKPNIPQPVQVEVEADTPTCSGAVNEEEDVWEKYLRDDPKAKKAASKFVAKRDRYPKRIHVVSQGKEEGGPEKETSTVAVVEEKGAREDREEVVSELKEGKDSEEETKSDLEEETEDQGQVEDDKLSTYSSEEELITLGPGEDAY